MGSRDRNDMADTKGGSFFGSVEEYVDARGGNRVIKKVRLCSRKHLFHKIMCAVSLGFRPNGCQPNVCIKATSVLTERLGRSVWCGACGERFTSSGFIFGIQESGAPLFASSYSFPSFHRSVT